MARSTATVPHDCPLRPRELEALEWLSKGNTYKQAALEMQISFSTIRGHLHNAYRTLGVPDRAQAVLLATRKGWLADPFDHLEAQGDDGDGCCPTCAKPLAVEVHPRQLIRLLEKALEAGIHKVDAAKMASAVLSVRAKGARPPVDSDREARVQGIKRAIERGTYKADPAEVAHAMLSQPFAGASADGRWHPQPSESVRSGGPPEKGSRFR